MAKTRKLRRAEREAQQEQARKRNDARMARRARRKALWRKASLHEARKRSTGRLFVRRSRGERAFIVVFAACLLFLIWYFSPSVPLAVALTALLLLFFPVLIILVFDKRST
jgi:Flp pilus assembly protein TadB